MSESIVKRMTAAVVASPVTGGAAEQVAGLDPGVIIARYAATGVDVQRYFEGVEQVKIFRCVDTGYRFYHPPEVAGEAAFYAELEHPDRRAYGDSEPDYRHWGDDYEFALGRLEPGETVLDVGCGFGYFLERAREKAEVMGIDGSPHAQARCEAKGIPFRLGSIQDHAEDLEARFDTVCAFHVLEHVYDVGTFLRSIVRVIKPGGRLIVAVPNNMPFIRRFEVYNTMNLPPHHMGLWNTDSLERAAANFGLQTRETDYSETSGRWVVEAYLHAAYLMGVTTELHHHSAWDKAKMLLAAPLTLPLSFVHYVRNRGVSTRNVLTAEFGKPA